MQLAYVEPRIISYCMYSRPIHYAPSVTLDFGKSEIPTADTVRRVSVHHGAKFRADRCQTIA